jgi:hypothetical protein
MSLLLTGCGIPNAASPTASSSGAALPGESSLSKTMQAVKECMEDAGLVVYDDGMGGLYSEGDLTAAQGELWSSENLRCSDELGLNDPFTEEELRELYALEVKNHQCLLDNGFESPEPPSEQTYVDSWSSGVKPYDSTDIVFTNGTFQSASKVCPSPRWSFG